MLSNDYIIGIDDEGLDEVVPLGCWGCGGCKGCQGCSGCKGTSRMS